MGAYPDRFTPCSSANKFKHSQGMYIGLPHGVIPPLSFAPVPLHIGQFGSGFINHYLPKRNHARMVFILPTKFTIHGGPHHQRLRPSLYASFHRISRVMCSLNPNSLHLNSIFSKCVINQLMLEGMSAAGFEPARRFPSRRLRSSSLASTGLLASLHSATRSKSNPLQNRRQSRVQHSFMRRRLVRMFDLVTIYSHVWS